MNSKIRDLDSFHFTALAVGARVDAPTEAVGLVSSLGAEARVDVPAGVARVVRVGEADGERPDVLSRDPPARVAIVRKPCAWRS